MSSRRFLAVVGAVAPLPRIAFGAEFVNRCVDLAAVRAAITGHNGKLIELTPDQWQFLRGIYAMNLETPPGLPCGDEAVLAHVDGEPDGLVFFVDGDKACAPMHAPRGLLSLMDQFAVGDAIIKGTASRSSARMRNASAEGAQDHLTSAPSSRSQADAACKRRPGSRDELARTN
jgi:hypothetical protein